MPVCFIGQWSGKNQTGAGTTIGEEVEQINSFLSRVALTTKYMSKAQLTLWDFGHDLVV